MGTRYRACGMVAFACAALAVPARAGDVVLPVLARSADGCYFANPTEREQVGRPIAAAAATGKVFCATRYCYWDGCPQGVARATADLLPAAPAATTAPAARATPVPPDFWQRAQPLRAVTLPARLPAAPLLPGALARLPRPTHERLDASAASEWVIGDGGGHRISALRAAGRFEHDRPAATLGGEVAATARLLDAPGTATQGAVVVERAAADAQLWHERLLLRVGRGASLGGDIGVVDGVAVAVQAHPAFQVAGEAGLVPRAADLQPDASAWNAAYRGRLAWSDDVTAALVHVDAGGRQVWWQRTDEPHETWLDWNGQAGAFAWWGRVDGRWRVGPAGDVRTLQPQQAVAGVDWAPWRTLRLGASSMWWREVYTAYTRHRYGWLPLSLGAETTPALGDVVTDHVLNADGWIVASLRYDAQAGLTRVARRDSWYGAAGVEAVRWWSRRDRLRLYGRAREGEPWSTWTVGVAEAVELGEQWTLRPGVEAGWRRRVALQSGLRTEQLWQLGIDWDSARAWATCEAILATGSYAPAAATLWFSVTWRVL